MAPFKDEINPQVVALWGERIGGSAAWVQETSLPLADLELKARVAHVAQGIWGVLGPELLPALERLKTAALTEPPLTGFAAWPAYTMVANQGLEYPTQSLETLGMLTHLFSAEFAVRPFIDAHPKLAMAQMLAWTTHDDEHHRRLASEGCRTRLPWGGNLRALIADPSPILPILEALRDDSSEYVRRSVSNNLNDLSKDHPAQVMEICERWSQGASKDRSRLIKHALRSLIKAGNPRALAIIGVGEPKLSGLIFQASGQVLLGEHLELNLRAELPKKQKLVVDFALHLKHKNGKHGRKVFKWRTLTAPAGPLELSKRHPLQAVTVRSYYPGVQKVELLVNGRRMGMLAFELTV